MQTAARRLEEDPSYRQCARAHEEDAAQGKGGARGNLVSLRPGRMTVRQRTPTGFPTPGPFSSLARASRHASWPLQATPSLPPRHPSRKPEQQRATPGHGLAGMASRASRGWVVRVTPTPKAHQPGTALGPIVQSTNGRGGWRHSALTTTGSTPGGVGKQTPGLMRSQFTGQTGRLERGDGLGLE